ncbi:acyltransferase family protein [Candidatus Shapirobacteria bacterium]|nr:acyltransferase family protein [Candidatus Shapirobacteria bacterium]
MKGLAILAVVVGHMATPLSKFIYSWHIPLFFFLSGLLIDTNKSLKESIIKDFKKLIIPFVLFGLVGLVAEYIKRWLWPGFNFVNENINLKDELFGIFWWMDFNHLHHYGFVLWFLPALFWAKNFYLVLTKAVNNELVISVTAVILGLLVAKSGIILPFGLDKGVLGLVWLSMGWLLNGKYWYISLVGLVFMKLPIINVAVKSIEVYGFIYSLFFINTLVGIFKWLENGLNFFNKFGKMSMEIFVLHPYVNNVVYFLIIYYLKHDWIVEVVVVLVMVTVVTSIYEKNKRI